VTGVDFPVHVLTVNALGLHLMDYLQFTELRQVCEQIGHWSFLCVIAPLRLPTGTGSPVNPARITGRERPPGASLRIVFLPVEQQHVIAQQDQRIRARTGSGDMAVVVHIPGRHQGRHVASDQSAPGLRPPPGHHYTSRWEEPPPLRGVKVRVLPL